MSHFRIAAMLNWPHRRGEDYKFVEKQYVVFALKHLFILEDRHNSYKHQFHHIKTVFTPLVGPFNMAANRKA